MSVSVGRVKKSDDEVAKQLAAIRMKRNKPEGGAGSSEKARMQTTLDGRVIADEPPAKNARGRAKSKTKPANMETPGRDEGHQSGVVADGLNTVIPSPPRNVEKGSGPTANQGIAEENQGAIVLHDPLADDFNADTFVEATLDVDGSGQEYVGEHGVEHTLYQLMRH